MTPVFRLEYFITAAANGTPCDLEPIFNEEKYLHAIAGASVDLPMPVGRTQEYLAKLAGMDVEIPDHPIFRTEYYLAHMIDSTVECPAPVFREEMFYYEWASNEYVTIVGNPVSFTAKAAPLRQLSVAFSPVQDLHGYDSPWPAGGGKNILPPVLLNNAPSITANGVTISIVNQKFRINETVTSSGGRLHLRTASFVLPAGDYYLDEPARISNLRPVPFIEKQSDNSIIRNDYGTFSLEAETEVYLGMNVTTGNVYNNYDYGIQLTKGTTATATWTPYSNECPISGWSSLTVYHSGADTSNPQTISINIGQTVYSGTVKFNQDGTADLTVDKASVDMSSLTWGTYVAWGSAHTFATNGIASTVDPNRATEMICEAYKKDTQNNILGGVTTGFYLRPDTKGLYVSDSRFTTDESFTDGVDGVHLTYPIATPVTYHIENVEIVNSLLGENNMWSNANGDLTVEYRSN